MKACKKKKHSTFSYHFLQKKVYGNSKNSFSMFSRRCFASEELPGNSLSIRFANKFCFSKMYRMTNLTKHWDTRQTLRPLNSTKTSRIRRRPFRSRFNPVAWRTQDSIRTREELNSRNPKDRLRPFICKKEYSHYFNCHCLFIGLWWTVDWLYIYILLMNTNKISLVDY